MIGALVFFLLSLIEGLSGRHIPSNTLLVVGMFLFMNGSFRAWLRTDSRAFEANRRLEEVKKEDEKATLANAPDVWAYYTVGPLRFKQTAEDLNGWEEDALFTCCQAITLENRRNRDAHNISVASVHTGDLTVTFQNIGCLRGRDRITLDAYVDRAAFNFSQDHLALLFSNRQPVSGATFAYCGTMTSGVKVSRLQVRLN